MSVSGPKRTQLSGFAVQYYRLKLILARNVKIKKLTAGRGKDTSDDFF
jgi:hypothetical protein